MAHKKYTFSICRKLNCHFQRFHQTCFIRITSLFWDSMDLQTGREKLVSKTIKKLIFITKLNATHNHSLNHILLRQKSIILRQEKQACWVLTQQGTIQHSHKGILNPNSWKYLAKLVCYHCLRVPWNSQMSCRLPLNSLTNIACVPTWNQLCWKEC